MSDPSERSGFLRDLPTLIGAIAVALAIRTLLVQPFYVPSDSMLPTLLVGDHVFVNKFLFGAGMTGSGMRFPPVREPKRGEVVVFQFARGPNGTNGRVGQADPPASPRLRQGRHRRAQPGPGQGAVGGHQGEGA